MNLQPLLSSIAPLDWAWIAVLGLSMIVGLWRGIVFELMSLAAWVLAWWAAHYHADLLLPWLPAGMQAAVWSGLMAYAATFCITLLFASVLARLARALVAASPLSVLDRVLGAGFGLLRGLLLLLVVSTVILWTPAARSPMWQASQGAAWLDSLSQWLRPLWQSRPGAPATGLPQAGETFFSFSTYGLHPCAASSA